jgi:hypothetical protein
MVESISQLVRLIIGKPELAAKGIGAHAAFQFKTAANASEEFGLA